MTDRRNETAMAPIAKRGIVRERDGTARRVRVEFPDEDGVAGYWYDVPGSGSSRSASHDMPDEGDEVWCVTSANGEEGFVAGTRYNASDTSPESDANVTAKHFRDGSSDRHDPGAGTRAIDAATINLGPGGLTPAAGVGHMVHVGFGSSAGMHPIATGSPVVKVTQ